MAAVSTGLRERTGHGLDEWVAMVDAAGLDPLDQTAVRRSLKADHGVPQNCQWAIADAAARAITTSPVGQCTHRVALTDVDEVDDEVGALLRSEYEQNG